jgi:hypothetical protein
MPSQSGMQDADYSPNKIASDSRRFDEPGTPTGTGENSTDDNPTNDDYWLLIARDAYNEAESYFDANVRSTLERNYSHFANRHAPGSKYFTQAYRHRAKGFRPKTRSMVRKNEAAAAVAMFSTSDSLHVKPARSGHPSHQISADINQELLQYRLDNTIPWYLTVIGAYQETHVAGVCISHQYWNYQEVVRQIPREDELGDIELDEDDMPVYDEDYIVVKDTPAVELRPIENVHFSVAADWRDPINTSPFLIDRIPMTIDEVLQMSKPGEGNRVPWRELTQSQLLTGVTSDYDPIRRQRENNREDSKDQRHLHRGFDTVWVHRNIVRKDGRDWCYYTLGVHYRLSDPIPLTEEYPHLKEGERPYVMGVSNIEAHKNYPDSLTGLVSGTQQRANDLDNQRFDNVRLSLNRRYITKRGAMIDYAGLQRNVPGGVTETDDPQTDIKIEAPPDVTASSYQEQDRINADFDELSGTFSQGSMNSNAGLDGTKTKGGMELLAGESDSMTEYPLRTFVETWVTPVLKQLIRLEQEHESDAALLNLIGEKMNLWKRAGIDRVTDAWIQGSMNIEVNVGFGATNPQQRVNRLSIGLQTILGFAPQLAQRLDGDEIADEVLGALGYSGSERFFPEDGQNALPGAEEGNLTEQDQASMDQDYQMHMEKLEATRASDAMKMEMKYMDMEMKQQDMLLKEQISQDQYEQNMAKIQVDRQTNVDKMMMSLEEMKLRRETGAGI